MLNPGTCLAKWTVAANRRKAASDIPSCNIPGGVCGKEYGKNIVGGTSIEIGALTEFKDEYADPFAAVLKKGKTWVLPSVMPLLKGGMSLHDVALLTFSDAATSLFVRQELDLDCGDVPAKLRSPQTTFGMNSAVLGDCECRKLF